MDIQLAARNTLTAWRAADATFFSAQGSSPLKRNSQGRGLVHQFWVLEQISTGIIVGEKAHRWLGYAQGYLVCEKKLTLEECKYANLFA